MAAMLALSTKYFKPLTTKFRASKQKVGDEPTQDAILDRDPMGLEDI